MKGNGLTGGFPLKGVPEHECLADSCLIGTEKGGSELSLLLLPPRQELLKAPSGSGLMYWMMLSWPVTPLEMAFSTSSVLGKGTSGAPFSCVSGLGARSRAVPAPAGVPEAE